VLLFLNVSVAFPAAVILTVILKFLLIIPSPVKSPVEVLSNGWERAPADSRSLMAKDSSSSSDDRGGDSKHVESSYYYRNVVWLALDRDIK
jgi:hypothetical protein